MSILPFVKPLGREPGAIKSIDWGQGMALNELNKVSRVDPALVPGEKTVLLIGVSQSNMTNAVNSLQTPVSSRVHNLNMMDGGVYTGEDPQLGCSWGNSYLGRPKWGGSCWPALGDKIIAGTAIDRVINAPIGVGGTSIQNWAPARTVEIANLFDRFKALMYHLELLKLMPSRYGTAIGTIQAAVIINIGETDAGSWGSTSALWVTMCQELIAGMRSNGLASDVPVLVTQATYGFTFANTIIRQAQLDVIDNGNHIYSGGDLDTLTGNEPAPGANRQPDGIHFSAVGQAAQAEIIYQKLRLLGSHWQ